VFHKKKLIFGDTPIKPTMDGDLAIGLMLNNAHHVKLVLALFKKIGQMEVLQIKLFCNKWTIASFGVKAGMTFIY
jgi:hypothetical protein